MINDNDKIDIETKQFHNEQTLKTTIKTNK